MTPNFKPKLLVGGVAVTLLAGGYTPPSYAAETAVLEEILVTARRRSENLQEIPESVTALNAELIENIGATNLKDISKVVPNLNLLAGGESFRTGVPQIVIRGITTPQNGEAPISFVIDGVTAPEIDFINQDLFDIESVQVLRGPQGALYGRGALGGAILVTTKRPTEEFSGFVKAGYEKGDDYRLQAGISGALVEDKVYFKLSGSYTDREGLIDNPTINEPVDFKDSTIVRGGLIFDVSDDLEIAWNFNYLDSEVGGGVFGLVPIEDFNRDFHNSVDQNILGVNTRDIFETSVKIEWNIGGMTLTSISGYGEVDDEIISDADFTASLDPGLDCFDDGDFTDDFACAQRNATDLETFTQELRLASADDQRLRWILGMFYQDRTKEFEFDFASDAARNPSGSFAERFLVTFEQRDNTDSTAMGVFAQVSYDLTDRLELTAALRYDEDERDFEDPRDSATTGADTDSSELQPKVSLSYDVSDDLLTYFTYSHGFRSGGFNEIGFGTGGSTPSTYDEETSDSYEIGAKATLLDGRMTINAALFYVELENNQFTSFDFDNFALGILGIDEAEIKGLDLEIAARPTDGLDLSFGLGISDSEIEDFDGTGLHDGNNIPAVPDYTLNFGAQYTWELNEDMDILTRFDFSRVGEINFDQANDITADEIDTINLRVGLKTDNWSLAAYMRNATGERTAVDHFDNDGITVGRAINAPQSYGVEVRFDF